MLKESIDYKRFVWNFRNVFKENRENKNIIFLCIGTNKVIGDSIGPMVGTNLKNKLNSNLKVNNIKVIGDMFNNISYSYIKKNKQSIEKLSKENFVIVIDSALSSEENIGKNIYILNYLLIRRNVWILII